MYSVILLFMPITMPIVICDNTFLCNDADVVKNRISALISKVYDLWICLV